MIKSEPQKLIIPLDNALVEKQLDLEGNFIGVIEATDVSSYLDIKFNTTDTEIVRFTKGLSFIRPFRKLFLTCAAQAGKSIELLISAYSPQDFQLIDHRAEALQTTELTAIKNYVRSLNGDTGTQVNKSLAQNVIGPGIIHTVTAGKTFYLTSLTTVGQGVSTIVRVRDAADVTLYELARFYQGGAFPPACRDFPTPIKILSGYDIVLVNDSPGPTGYACINGWEE
ncbi:MAG: hypothetical protein V1933_08005 [Candidatus Omnitrophota bacterium]